MKNRVFFSLMLMVCGLLFGKADIRFELVNSNFFFDVYYNNRILFEENEIGLVLDGIEKRKFTNYTIDESQVEDDWFAHFGQNTEVKNRYRLYKIDLYDKEALSLKLEFRLYEDGVAFRYLDIENNRQIVNKELTRLNIVGKNTKWIYREENDPVGPLGMHSRKKMQTHPAVIYFESGEAAAIQEAAIMEYAPFKMNIYPKTISLVLENQKIINKYKSSWRVIKLAENAGKLTESRLLENCNEPCQIADTSFIKPGESMWDWRVSYYKAADGFKYGLNTESHKRFIDFAAENKIEYLVIDADWYGPEFSKNSDPTQKVSNSRIRIEECMEYAKEKGVGIFLYLNDVGAKKYGLEDTLERFANWGAKGIKYGFMTGEGQEKVRWTRRVIEECAKNELMVVFHDDPIPPSGDMRTYPNVISREFGFAQSDGWTSRLPNNSIWMFYLNMLAGELDLTYGWYSHWLGREMVDCGYLGTVVAETAKVFLYHTGLAILPDAPEEYLKKSDLFDVVRQLPPTWDEYRFLAGEAGQWCAIARRTGDKWFVAAANDEKKRTVRIPLDFLWDVEGDVDNNDVKSALIFEDGEGASFRTRKGRSRYNTSIVTLTREGKAYLDVKMASGGGFVGIIE